MDDMRCPNCNSGFVIHFCIGTKEGYMNFCPACRSKWDAILPIKALYGIGHP
ncbi:MAG: hypothetical protein ACMUHM_00660 [Thermoplasmatota archaeon]